MGQFIVIIIVIAVVAVGAYFAHLAEKKRREEMAALAAKLGFRFRAGPDSSHDEEFSHFEIFRRGHSRVAKNMMSGAVEIDGRSYRVDAGDFRYKVTSGSGKSRSTRTYDFSYIILHLPFDCPDLLIRKEGMFDKIAGAFGFDDIDFESAEFSKKFHVKSPDKKFAYDVCHPRMMERLLASFPAILDLERGRLCFADESRRWEPNVFEQRFDWLEKWFQMWPEHVLVDLDRSRNA